MLSFRRLLLVCSVFVVACGDGRPDDLEGDLSVATSAITGPQATGDRMLPNQLLNANQFITSSNGKYMFIYQGDGNIVLYRMPYWKVLWASGTNGSSVGQLVMQGDGNLVIYPATGKTPWTSRTNGNDNSTLIVQNDGNVVIYSPTKAIWATNTVQPISPLAGNPIALRFININSNCSNMSGSNRNRAAAVASATFRDTGLSFSVYPQVDSFPLAKDNKNDSVTWADLKPLWQGLGISCSSCASQGSKALADWLWQIAEDYLPRQVIVWVGCGTNRGNPAATSIFLGSGSAYQAGHELGHAFGNPNHSFEVGLNCDYWDLVYAARGRGKANRYFANGRGPCENWAATERAAGRPFTFYKIDPRDPDDDGNPDTIEDVEENGGPRRFSNGLVTAQNPRCQGCTTGFGVPDDGVEEYVTGADQIAGYAKLVDGRGAVNAMTYCSGDKCPDVSDNFFSPSQLENIDDHVADRPWLFPDPQCTTGISHDGACCEAGCGTCGGTGCGSRPGGAAACCVGTITSAGLSCAQTGPPCLLP